MGMATVAGYFVWLSGGSAVRRYQRYRVTKMYLPPFIATMAMQMIAKGLSLVISGIKPVYFTGAPGYQKIAIGEFLGIKGFYNAIIIFIIVAIIAHIIFSKTLIGRYDLAIGSNEEATRLSGIKVDRWKIGIYSLCGLFCGIGRTDYVLPSEFRSAAAGSRIQSWMRLQRRLSVETLLQAEEGSIIGTVIGALIISSLTNGLRIMQVSSEIQSAIVGIVLALAVFIDQVRRRREAK